MRFAVSRQAGAHRVVTPLELFFDLVYVFAIGQLTHHLVAHVDLRTGAETLVLALLVTYAWYMVAWGANWLDPDRNLVRGFLIALMFASLLMSAGISEAFGDRAWLFVTGYVGMQLMRTTFLIGALRDRPLGQHFVNDRVWELVSGALLVAGALSDGDLRLTLWSVAVVVTYVGIWTLHPLPGRGSAIDLEHTEISGEHLLERFRLFFIIALGETVLVTATAFDSQPFDLERLVALVVAFAGTVALWWCYFHSAEGRGMAVADEADDAGTVAWLITFTVTAMVVALIGIAAADELMVAHPDYEPDLAFTLLTFGGPALFLLAKGTFVARTTGSVPRAHIAGIAALAVLAVVTAPLTLLAAGAAAVVVLVAVATRG